MDVGRRFPQLRRWFDDHFGFRRRWCAGTARAACSWLGVSPSAAVVKGRDGWFFYARRQGGRRLRERRAADAAATRELARGDRARARLAAGRGDRATSSPSRPTSMCIYREDDAADASPASATCRAPISCSPPAGHRSRRRRPAGAARGQSAASGSTIKTDTHWNDRGALVAYQQIINAVRARVPSTPPAWTRDDFDAVERTTSKGWISPG